MFQLFFMLIALVIFAFSSTFSGGMENAFGFLFWINFLLFIPFIIIWFVMQIFAVASFSTLIGSLLAPIISLIGWGVLFIFGINVALTWYISEHINNAHHLFDLPLPTQIALIIYIILAFNAKKILAKGAQEASFRFRSTYSSHKPSPRQKNDDVIIDAEIIEETPRIK